MPKRDKYTSVLGKAPLMPSFNVIWFEVDIIELMLIPVIYFCNEFTK